MVDVDDSSHTGTEADSLFKSAGLRWLYTDSVRCDPIQPKC